LTGLILAAAVIGGIASFFGSPALFVPVAGVVFICGLPFALISSFIHGFVSYSEDRKDKRAWELEDTEYEIAAMREDAEDSRWDMREAAENERAMAKREAEMRRGDKVIVDNRQIHFH
jgi:phage shock protein PspC (stress-responsive transcriptional regulator)